ncbi:MAG: putative sugar O-methyltransferase, partial [Burkholderiales bacterium]
MRGAGPLAFLLAVAGCGPQGPAEPPQARPVLLQHQRLLTDGEYERALAAWRQGKKSFEQRASYLKARKLDPAFFMPGLGWADIVTNPFREFLAEEPSRTRVDQLRLHTQAFTGFSLHLFRYTRGVEVPPEVVPVEAWDKQHRQRIPDRSVRAFEQLRATLPAKYVVKVPRVMGEVGWNVAGHVVNWDLVPYQESIEVLHRSGVLAWLERRAAAGERITVVEIGSGYGGFAYYLTEILPGASYWLCDLPESLPVAAMYLSVTRPALWKGVYPDCPGGCGGAGLVGLANYRFEELGGELRKVDLVINMMSLSEMPEVQIDYYGRKVSALLGDDGIFFEQNYDNRKLGFSNSKEVLPRHFKANTDLGESAYRGHGHLWANRPEV